MNNYTATLGQSAIALSQITIGKLRLDDQVQKRNKFKDARNALSAQTEVANLTKST